MKQTGALRYHFARYPEMTAQDVVKLLYQSEYGCGHMIKDKHSAREYLEKELSEVTYDYIIPPLTTEPLGGDAFRVNLMALPPEMTPKTLSEIFCISSTMFNGTDVSFREKLALVPRFIDAGLTSFSLDDYNQYLDEYYRAGGGAVHHSDKYRELYHPAYRVIHAHFAPFIDVFARIDRMLEEGRHHFSVAIDGSCGSGKTTLADLLRRVYGCGIVHTDDFYLPFRERSGQLGGLDAPRMRREITPDRDTFSYRAYDPHTDRFTHEVQVKTSPFFVVEGSYSHGVDCGIDYDLKVFLTIGGEEQLRRLSIRNPGNMSDFIKKWIPAEEDYFDTFEVTQKSDLVIRTDSW